MRRWDMADEHASPGRANEELARDIEFLDSVRALPAAAARKERLVQTLGVEPGAVVLEVGPGTGEDLLRFAAAAEPSGLAVGVDISLGLAREAQQRAAAAGASNASLVVADVCRLPFPTATFGHTYVERVLQHVPEIGMAVDELYRTLTPGGRAVVFEPDQELRALDHPDWEVERVLRPRVAPAVANPTAGRRLLRLLTDAGFIVDNVEGTASVQTRATVPSRVADAIDAAVHARELAADKGAAYLATLHEMARTGPLVSIWIAFEAAARKPAL